MTQQEIKAMMEKMQNDDGDEATVKPVRFSPITPHAAGPVIKASLSHLDDVTMDIYAVLGQTQLKVRELLNLEVGSVVELDKSAGESADVYINGQAFARGEVLVINDYFAVRINNINRGSCICNLKKPTESNS